MKDTGFRNKFLGRLFRFLGVFFIFWGIIGLAIAYGLHNNLWVVIFIGIIILGIFIGFKGIKKLHKIGEW